MKVLAIVLLCAFAAVQGRSAGDLSIRDSKALANLGENPWYVYVRVAVSTGGELRICGASFIHTRWVLTASTCVLNERFTWLSFGTVDASRAELVLETSANRVHPYMNVALINTNRDVESSANIRAVTLRANPVPSTTSFCGFGSNANGGPGGFLNCFPVSLTETPEDEIVAFSNEGAATRYDMGAPLISNGNQIGLLQGAGTENAGIFVPASIFISWVEAQVNES